MLLVVLIFLHGIGKRLGDVQFGNVAIVECERNRAIIVGVDNEVGCNLLQGAPYGLADSGTGLGVQLP